MVIKMVQQRTGDDCTIVALAMFLDETYEDVLACAAAGIDFQVHHKGMWNKQMIQVADIMGTPLREKHKWDEETAEGIVILKSAVKKDPNTHVVVLKDGLIFDGDLSVWEPDVYYTHYQWKPWAILVRREKNSCL